MRPHPLPAHLLPAPFRRRDALVDGVSEDRLRSKDLDRSVRGVRNAEPATDLLGRCRLFATRLRGDVVFSHRTAALLSGAPMPPLRERSEVIDVTVPAPEPSPHAQGLRGHSRMLDPDDIVVLDDLRVTTPARTLWDLASVLALPDLVAVGDYFLRADESFADSLSSLLETRSGQRGARRARAARDLLDGRAESAPEPRLRAVLAEAGLSRPEVSFPVEVGGFRYRLDLAFVDAKVALEYQGDYHRSREQWRRDMTRRSRVESVGWTIVELNGDDLLQPRELCARIAAILARSGA